MARAFRVEQAEDFLRKLIAEDEFAHGARLPSLAMLSQYAGVSLVTMWKAVQRLKRIGVLDGRPHAMSRVAVDAPQEKDGGATDKKRLPRLVPVTCGKRARATADRIEHDVINGVFPPGKSIDSIKVLCSRYGVCRATMRNALNALVENGILLWNRKKLVAPHLQTRSPGARITIIGIDAPHEPLALGVIGRQALQCIEMECARAGIGVDILRFHPSEEGISYTDLASGKACELTERKETQGYLYLVIAETAAQEAVFRRLQRFRKPVAIFDIVGIDPPECVRNDRNFRLFFSTPGMLPGIRMARFLTGIGHRGIAYLSPFHRFRWSQARLNGLRKGCVDSGYPEAIRPFVVSRTHDDFFLSNGRMRGIDAFWKMFEKWESRCPKAALRHFAPTVRRSAELEGAASEVRQRMSPLFAKALADPSITAWVCANDGLATFALDFLAEKGIPVPERISVAGFDDSEDAIDRRLTSYNFNITALAHAMLDYVLRTESTAWSTRRKRMEIDGVIIERKTTAPPANIAQSGR